MRARVLYSEQSCGSDVDSAASLSGFLFLSAWSAHDGMPQKAHRVRVQHPGGKPDHARCDGNRGRWDPRPHVPRAVSCVLFYIAVYWSVYVKSLRPEDSQRGPLWLACVVVVALVACRRHMGG